jgi:hypothetical protein
MIEGTHSEKVEDEIKDYLGKKREDLNQEDFYDKPKKNNGDLIRICFLVLLLFFVFAYFSYSKGHSSFANEKVRVSIEASDQIGSGDETSFTVSCINDNRVSLTNAKLEIFFPDNFIMKSSDQKIEQSGQAFYWNLQNIGAQSTTKIRVYGKVIGKIGEEKIFKAVLSFRPSNFNSDFQSQGTKSSKISSIPVELNLNFPESIKDSSESELTFSYKNKSDRDFGKVKLEAEFPANFIYINSTPTLTKVNGSENIYSLEGDNFSKGTDITVKISGSFQSQNDKETVKARIYLLEENGTMTEYDEETKDINMIKTEILISQTINNTSEYNANKNESLNYQINFKNQSGQEIKGLVLKSALDGNFDLKSLKTDKGTVSGNNITWNAINVPELASLMPGSVGSVTFTVNVIDHFDITKESDKNYTLKNIASISSFGSSSGSQNIENVIAKNEIDSKVKAFLYLDAKGYFNDDGRIQNGGQIPPKVGQQTFYTIHWSVRNFFNDTENIRVTAVLPQGVTWTGKYIDSNDKVYNGGNPADNSPGQTNTDNVDAAKITEEKIYYNNETHEVTWEIPNLKANDGVLTPAKEIIFQIAAIPSANDVGSPMTLIDNTTVSGNDTYIGSTVTNTGTKITTDLTSSDYSIGNAEAIVKE